MSRKPTMRFPWADVILGIMCWAIVIWLSGCVHVRHGDFEYWRLGDQQIGEALLTLPDGSELLLDGQKSEMPVIVVTPAGVMVGKQVQP